MSTKSTIVYGNNFHLYKDLVNEDFIWLEMEQVQFEASYNRVKVSIPVHIWEVIRQYEGTDLSWAEATDEEIVRYVEQQIDERIERYQQAENEQVKNLIDFMDSIVYDSANTSRSNQIKRGIGHFKELKKHQLQIKNAIADLSKTNLSGE